MGYNFARVDREQLMLMPPSMAEWLPSDHLVWFVIEAVDEFDLSLFVANYRSDGRGGAAYHPAMMVALMVYAYAVGERSSRRIERRCVEDVAFRVVAANQRPDHATIARFRATHTEALAGLFGQVLVLCSKAGVLRPGLLAIDGTKLGANASRDANRTAAQLAAEILAEAAAVDAAEDAAEAAAEPAPEVPDELRSRGPKRRERLRALLDELNTEAAERSYEAHMERRAETEAAAGRPMRGRRPDPDSSTYRSRSHANLTDPDSRLLKTRGGYVQGYNAQAVATQDQFVVAAEATNAAHDAALFEPMVAAAKQNLRAAGERRRPRRVLADAGYWSADNINTTGVEVIIAPGKARRLGKIADQDQQRRAILEQVEAGQLDKPAAAAQLGITRSWLYELLRRRRDGDAESLTHTIIAKLDTPHGKRLYAKRAATIEPVFAQIKHNRGIRTLSRRGLTAVDSEWKLICATHNLLKLSRLA